MKGVLEFCDGLEFVMVRARVREASMHEKPLISVIDDEEPIRASLESLLKSLSFEVRIFASAIEFLQSSHLGRTSCLIADVNMPHMTGLTLFERLKASGVNIPTILITGYPSDAARRKALKDGVSGYLVKPFAEDDLLACIGQALNNP